MARSKKWRDQLPGGRADRLSPSAFNRAQLQFGAKVEREHTRSAKLAREIAMDHLTEDPAYYRKLNRAGLVDGLSSSRRIGLPLVFAIGVLSSIVGGLIVVKMTGKNGG